MSEHLKTKLALFAPPPPDGTWAKIADVLDTEVGFAQRLQHYQEEPPLSVWTAIDAELGGTDKKTISIFRRYSAPLRYVAAASILAVLLAGATLLLKPTPENGKTSTVGTTQQEEPVQNKPDSPGNSINEKVVASSAAAQNVNAASRTPARDESGKAEFVKRSLAFVRPQNVFAKLSFTRRFIPKQANEQVVIDNSKISEALMVFSDGDGTAMRLPKRVFSLVNCADGDGSCKERIRQLQRKMAANTAAPDFTGMLDMLRQLQ